MKNFLSKWDYVLWILFGSMVGAWMRSNCLLRGYEENGLPIAGFHSAYALISMTIVVFFGVVLLGQKLYKGYRDCTFEQLFCGMGTGKATICGLCGVGVTLASLAGLATLSVQIEEQSNEYQKLGMVVIVLIGVMWVLGLLSGIGLVLTARKQAGQQAFTAAQGIWITLPMLWFALDLIMVYHENSGNPVISDYSYNLLLIISIMLAFHGMAGFLFSPKPSASRFFTAAGAVVYLAFVQSGGLGLAILGGYDRSDMMLGDMIRSIVYALIALYMLVQLIHASAQVEKIRKAAQQETNQLP